MPLKPRFLLLVCLLGIVKGDCDAEHSTNVLESAFGPVLSTRFGEHAQATKEMIEETVKSELAKQDQRMMEKMNQMQTAFLGALEEQGEEIKDLIQNQTCTVKDDKVCPDDWFNIEDSCIFIGGRREQDVRPIANTG